MDPENPRKQAAKLRARDSHGHFAHPAEEESSLASKIARQTSFHEDADDSTLVDVHVNNPLQKITHLLEQIKKQKAFFFTLKGSLGVMGVVLTLSLFGIFGSSKLLCDKGTQSKVGTIKALKFIQKESTIPVLGSLINYFQGFTKSDQEGRVVLETPYSELIHLIGENKMLSEKYLGQKIIATGDYDFCSQTLKISEPSSVQEYY